MLLESIDEDRSQNPMYREFRAAWFSTVANIDWPIMGGSESKQKALIIKYLDTLYNNNFNAVFVQVKPDAGVIFKSKINLLLDIFSVLILKMKEMIIHLKQICLSL
ncbi:Uncharacterized protein conserved in bacteria [Brachyspira pilosicoli]|uniref:family 10 glycosylhydrolase n=1 Tax=Brachyspira pilosicoli TaxID=52584 RepID=UPI000E116BC8|nr:family 10 glycosylhydrolase [Brachyspira pilosicoli]SUW21344.1 Uncharacterized protein conserved in bacteria [Brachyspira pilosicoli]